MSLPPDSRLVFRAGFAGRGELFDKENASLARALDDVLSVLGKELAALVPGVPVRAGKEPRVAKSFSKQCPLLRLNTGLCEGADAVVGQGISAIHSVIGCPHTCNHLLNNCRTKFFFANDCPQTSRYFEAIGGEEERMVESITFSPRKFAPRFRLPNHPFVDQPGEEVANHS